MGGQWDPSHRYNQMFNCSKGTCQGNHRPLCSIHVKIISASRHPFVGILPQVLAIEWDIWIVTLSWLIGSKSLWLSLNRGLSLINACSMPVRGSGPVKWEVFMLFFGAKEWDYWNLVWLTLALGFTSSSADGTTTVLLIRPSKVVLRGFSMLTDLAW